MTVSDTFLISLFLSIKQLIKGPINYLTSHFSIPYFYSHFKNSIFYSGQSEFKQFTNVFITYSGLNI